MTNMYFIWMWNESRQQVTELDTLKTKDVRFQAYSLLQLTNCNGPHKPYPDFEDELSKNHTRPAGIGIQYDISVHPHAY